jgi:hypothetical protein
MNNCVEFLTTWYMPIVLKDKILHFQAFINAYVDEKIIICAVTILKHEHMIHTKNTLFNTEIMINFLE